MRIISAKLLLLRIPLKHPFSHSLAVRHCTESVAVQLTSDTGETGTGEGAPRAYVTGETTESCLAHIRKVLLPDVFRHEFLDSNAHAAAASLLDEINGLLPATGHGGVIAFHAAKCAVELALLDVTLKHAGRSLGDLLVPRRQSLVYSAVIGADTVATARKTAAECVRRGMRYFKVKVGHGDDYGRVAAVRETAGAEASLRVDANGALSATAAVALLHQLCPLDIKSIEQPVKRGDMAALVRVREDSPIPVMVDESLVTEPDAMALIEHHACDIFNLRLSKNGGFGQTLRLAEIARAAGLGVQVGCQAGETAILAAAGRHLAAHLHEVEFLEGSYGRMLLDEDVSRVPVEFGYGGAAPLLQGAGLGIELCRAALDKHSVTTIDTSATLL